MSETVSSLVPALEVVERGLAAARGGGCVVIVEDASEIEVRFANNSTTTNGTRRNRRVTVVRTHERAAGISTGVASASGSVEIGDLVAAADKRAVSSEEFADDAAPLVDGGFDAGLEDAPAMVPADAIGSVVAGLADAFGRARAEGRILAGFATTERSTCVLGSSAGTRRRHVQPTGSLQLVARSPDGTRSAWAGVAGADLNAADLARLDERVASRLAAAEKRIELPAGRYEVILPPDAVADLMIVLADAVGGRDALDGRSVFSAPGGGTRLGQQISPLPFRLEGDPARSGIECIPFLAATSSSSDVSVFDDGSPIGACRWIDDGSLERLRFHRVGAQRADKAFAPPIDNLALGLPGASDSLEDLVARTERGLLLTCLWYIREVDVSTLLLTGLTRDGVYLVEDGEVVGAVNNFRFNESPVDVLARAVEAGRSERALSREWGEWMNRTIMPALRVEGFNMSSVSPAN